jgi:hypothetical protein
MSSGDRNQGFRAADFPTAARLEKPPTFPSDIQEVRT